ncbi:hypothetical protein NHQ30_005157 [Ciborinia camelliae]|nr:hypothetical protein NHQ30_005157 [Ciborinia camelliae]
MKRAFYSMPGGFALATFGLDAKELAPGTIGSAISIYTRPAISDLAGSNVGAGIG